MIQYGLISQTDARTIEKTLDLICKWFAGQVINTCEIGVFDGQTSRGIYDYIIRMEYASCSPIEGHDEIEINNFKCNHTAIDNNKDKQISKPFPECNLIIGNSNEVYNQLKNDSQHLILVDGNHSFPYVISDFFCYADKVKVGGYMAFHDTGKHIAKFKDYQRMGSENDEDMYISVRKALDKIGLLECTGYPTMEDMGWQLIFDEADTLDLAGGISVFKKLY